MNGVYKTVLSDKIAKWGLMLSGIILFLEIIYIGIFYFSLPPLLPIYNQLPWGEERLGSRFEIFLPFLLTLIFFIFNFFLIARLHEKLPLLSRMLSITTFLISILSIFFTVRTLQLIT
jgi:hypothetical protein